MAERTQFAKVSGYPLTYVSTDAKYFPGEVREVVDDTLGLQKWVYVKNDSGSSYTQGLGVMLKDAAVSFGSTNLSTTTASHGRFIGVAQHTIPDQSYGWILQAGFGYVAASAANIAANASLKCVAGGLFTGGTTGTDDLVAWAPAAVSSGSVGVARITG